MATLPPAASLHRAARRIVQVAALASAALCAGCNLATVAYNQSATLGYWWLDGYIDLDRRQAPAVKAALAETLAWHRRTQLPELARDLDRLKAEVQRDATADQACDWWRRLLDQRDAIAEHAAPAIAELAVSLSPAQLRQLERKLRERDDVWRKEHLQADLAERESEQQKRLVERIERLYGDLSRPQETWLSDQVKRSPWDPERWLADRQAHQRFTLESARQLRALQAPQAPHGQPAGTAGVATSISAGNDEALSLTRRWLQGIMQPLDAEARRARDRLVRHQCALSADFHNRTTAQQRQHAADTLGGWARDARVLAGDKLSAANAP